MRQQAHCVQKLRRDREGDLPSTFLLLWICHEVPTAFWSWNSAKMLYGSSFNNNPKMQSNAYSGFPSYNGEGKYHFCTIYTRSERKKQPWSVRFFYQQAVLQLLLIPPNQTLHFSNIRKGPPNAGRRDRSPRGPGPSSHSWVQRAGWALLLHLWLPHPGETHLPVLYPGRLYFHRLYLFSVTSSMTSEAQYFPSLYQSPWGTNMSPHCRDQRQLLAKRF